ncbi:scarecrow-like protein 23 [Silene latifolia]|uniref:scarecrow-like protein 23 n=1 Tax=Silene latifolia TaxID=37657 RepID=UPI003D77B97D
MISNTYSCNVEDDNDDHGHDHNIEPHKPDSEQSALHLLTLLIKCADHITTNNTTAATNLLPEINLLSTPYGSPPHRVAAYFSHSISSLLINTHLRRDNHSIPSSPSLRHHHLRHLHAAFQSYNSLTPLIKFSHFTSNQAIYDVVSSPSFDGCDHVHVIDVDVMQGLQWPGFFHIISSSSRKLVSVKLTGFGPDMRVLTQTGRRLEEFAGSAGVQFEFNPVQGRIGDLTELSRLGPTRSDSVVVLHWVHHGVYDVCGSRDGFVRVLAAVRPRLVTMVEQGLPKTTSFQGRFVGAIHYYSALFDALGEGLGRDSVQRYMVEHHLFGREIKNVLDIEDRVGVVPWADELNRIGFETFSLSGSPATQASLLLEMFPWKGYTLMEENGRLKLGWKDLPLLTASAWQPKDYCNTAK